MLIVVDRLITIISMTQNTTNKLSWISLQQHDVQNSNAKRPITVPVWGGCDVLWGGMGPQAQA